MLHYIAFSNFCSFRERSIIDLRVTEGAPQTDEFVTGSTDTRVTKSMALIGANAAGKSNGLRAIAFLQFFLVSSFQILRPDDEVPVDSFLFRQDIDVPVFFDTEVSVDGVDYRYSCSLLPKGVLSEQLDIRDRSPRYRNLIRREGQEIEITRTGIGISGSALGKMLRENSSVLALLHQLENPLVSPLTNWFELMVTNITRNMSHRFQSLGWTSFDAASLFDENEALFEQAREIMLTSDFGLADIDLRTEKLINSETGKEKEVPFPFGVHVVDGKPYDLPMMLESDGTEGLFVLLSKLLPVLATGGCAVINDLETDLHPDILPSILHLFLDEETNPKNAQLIFTTHAHEFVFSRLDKRAISIVEKTDGLSSVTRLDSLDGVRTDVDLLKKYRAGLFGGIPNI